MLDFLLLNRDDIVDTLRLTRQSCRDKVLHIDQSVGDRLRIILNVPVHFESLKYRLHLLLGQALVRELLQQLIQEAQGDLVLILDDLAREQLPLLSFHLLRDLLEQVNGGVLHDLLMERAVGRFTVV